MTVAATGPDGRRCYEVADPSVHFRGGYGMVFQATLVDDHLGEERHGLRVSLKLFSGADGERWAKLVSRSPQLARLSHPNLAAHLEAFDGHPLARTVLGPDEPTHHWTANEWVPGQPLADSDMNLPVNDILALFSGPAEAVDFLHAAGVAHRDLHPRNLILTDDRRLVVIDYDTALTAASTTTTRTLAGTQFTADLPEGARVDPFLADVVAFSRCLVHTLAGDGDGALDEGQALNKAIVRIKPLLADPDRFADLLQAGLAGKTAGCSTWLHELRAAATSPPGLRATLGRQARKLRRAAHRASARPRSLRYGLAVAIAVLVVLGSLLFQQRGETARRSATATSRALAAASAEWADRDPVHSAMLALSAYRAQPTAEATAALFRSYLESQGATSMFSGPQGGLSAVQASRDGRVVAGVTSRTVTVWARSPGQETRRISTPSLRDPGTFMALSPDGAAVWLVDDGWLARFGVSDGQLRRITEVAGTGEVVVSADGATVAVVVSSGGSRRAVVWNARDGRLEPERLLPPAGTLMEASLGPGGSLVAHLNDRDGAGQLVQRLEVWGPGDGVRQVLAQGPDSRIVVTPTGDVAVTCAPTGRRTHRLAAVRLADGVELGQAEVDFSCLEFAADPSGLMVVEKGSDSSGAVLDLQSGKIVSRVRAPLLSDSTSRVVPVLAGSGDDLHLVVWTKSGITLLAVPPPGTIVPEMPYSFLSPDGHLIVGAVGKGSELMTYPVAGTTPLARAPRPAPFWPTEPSDLICNVGCSLVADRVSAERIALRRLPGLELVREVTTPPVPSQLESEVAQRAHGMFFLADRLISVVGHQVDVWDVASGDRVGQLDLVELGYATQEQIVRLGAGPKPDQLGLIVEGRPDVRVLDIYRGQQVATVPVGTDAEVALFRGSSSLILIVRNGGAVEVWDRERGRRVFGPLAAEKDFGRRIRFLDEPGRFVVSDYGRYQTWDVGSARPRLQLQLGELQRITSVSGDGRIGLYYGSQAYIGVLNLSPSGWRDHLCSVIGHRGFGDERQSELPPLTPERLCP